MVALAAYTTGCWQRWRVRRRERERQPRGVKSAFLSLLHRWAPTAAALIVVNALVWWLCYVLSRSHLDPYGDMVEAYAWGINWVWGYDKHPPLSGWVAAAWFTLFPTRDWAYYLLAALNQALAFWWLYLAARMVLVERAAYLALGLAMLVPLFGADTGFKYNANSAMLPWVAGFAWAMLHAIKRQSAGDAALAGVFVALTFLSKYYAAVVLGAVALALALQWRRDLRALVGPGVIAALIAGVLITPHLAWAVRNHWPTLHYAIESHVIEPGTHPTWNALLFAVTVAVLPTLVWVGLVGWDRRRQRSHKVDESRTGAAFATAVARPPGVLGAIGGLSWWLAVAFTVAAAAWTDTAVAPKWLIPAWLFYGWWLCDLAPAGTDWAALAQLLRRFLGVFWVTALVAALVLMARDQARPLPTPTGLQARIATDVSAGWRAATGTSLAYVGGTVPLAYAVSFYAAEHPVALVNTDFVRSSWTTRAAVEAAGIAVLCVDTDPSCEPLASAALGPPRSRQVWRYAAQHLRASTPITVVVELLVYPPHPPRGPYAARTP